MRVLLLTDSAEVHGAEANLLDLVANLGGRVELFAGLPAAGRVTYELAGPRMQFVLLPFPTADACGFGMKHWLTATRSAAALVEFIRKHGIDLVHSITTGAHLVGGMAAHKAGVPAVWHARRLRPLRRVRALLEGSAQRIVAPWDCARATLVEQGVAEQSIVRVNDGVDPHSVVPHAGFTLPERAALPKGAFVFVAIGHESSALGLDTFARAAASVSVRHPEARFWWAGRAATKSRRVSPLVALGDRDDLRDLLHAADCVVIPTREEESGRVALEALCAGRAVIGSDVGAHREALLGAGCRVPPGDDGKLASAMLTFLTKRQLVNKLRDASRRRAATEFSMQRHVERVLELYAELLSPR